MGGVVDSECGCGAIHDPGLAHLQTLFMFNSGFKKLHNKKKNYTAINGHSPPQVFYPPGDNSSHVLRKALQVLKLPGSSGRF